MPPDLLGQADRMLAHDLPALESARWPGRELDLLGQAHLRARRQPSDRGKLAIEIAHDLPTVIALGRT